jgi:hypothetical protein
MQMMDTTGHPKSACTSWIADLQAPQQSQQLGSIAAVNDHTRCDVRVC